MTSPENARPPLPGWIADHLKRYIKSNGEDGHVWNGVVSRIDCGIVMQTIAIAATAFGLGTCIEVAGVVYPEELRRLLNIAEDKQIVCSIAIGYADADAPENNFERPRESLDNLVTWHGL